MKKLLYTIIKDKKQYESYCNKLEKLSETITVVNEDERELLSYLIQKYNDEQMENFISELNPVELLLSLIKDNKISQKELSERITVSPQLVNDIIKYRREITKNIAIKLAEEFNVNYAAFLKPYSLQRAS